MSSQNAQLGEHASKKHGRGVRERLNRIKFYLPQKIILEIDKNAKLIEFAQTVIGRIVLFLCFAITLQALGQNPCLALMSALCAFTGKHRWYLTAILTSIFVYFSLLRDDQIFFNIICRQEMVGSELSFGFVLSAVIILVIVLSSCLIYSWPRIIGIRFFRRSTLCLLLSFLMLVVIAQSPLIWGRPRVVLCLLLVVFPSYLWFLSYALGDVGAGERGSISRHLGVLHSFWSASTLPFGKGITYLRKFEAKTPAELAITQLKGLKLGLWAFVLLAGCVLIDRISYDYLQIPQYDATFLALLSGSAPPWYICWLSMFTFFFYDIAVMACIGAVYVACARMAGFRILRNTYKPLTANTIAEFWNRYSFYYKELMVDQFFYPTFFRCFRKHPRLRIFFATFVAACVGNLFFHFALDIHFVPELGLRDALIGEEPHALYTVLLALGIAFSQMRQRAIGVSRGWLRGCLLPRIRVVLFFCVLHVFDAPHDREHTIWQHVQYLFHLFGIDAWT